MVKKQLICHLHIPWEARNCLVQILNRSVWWPFLLFDSHQSCSGDHETMKCGTFRYTIRLKWNTVFTQNNQVVFLKYCTCMVVQRLYGMLLLVDVLSTFYIYTKTSPGCLILIKYLRFFQEFRNSVVKLESYATIFNFSCAIH